MQSLTPLTYQVKSQDFPSSLHIRNGNDNLGVEPSCAQVYKTFFSSSLTLWGNELQLRKQYQPIIIFE
jgi:hypothetical protein